jgi:restriction system protein
MSMSLNLTRKQAKKRSNIVSVCSLVTFIASWYFLKTTFTAAGISAVIVYVGVYIIYEILDFRKRKILISSGISDIDTMDGFQFEHYLVELFKKYHYKAVRTPDSGDYGADLILKKDGKKIVVQAKRYVNNVGIKAVQEVLGAKSYYKADEGWVVANSNYTKAAIKLAKESNVRLVARAELVSMLLHLQTKNDKPNPKEIKQSVEAQEKKICSECGSEMVLRSSKHGVFWGCTNFPKCTHVIVAK